MWKTQLYTQFKKKSNTYDLHVQHMYSITHIYIHSDFSETQARFMAIYVEMPLRPSHLCDLPFASNRSQKYFLR
jgi:hypothetical protein